MVENFDLEWLNFKQCQNCYDSIYTVSKIKNQMHLPLKYDMKVIFMANGGDWNCLWKINIDGIGLIIHPKPFWKTNLEKKEQNSEWGELIHGTDLGPHGRGRIHISFNASFEEENGNIYKEICL